MEVSIFINDFVMAVQLAHTQIKQLANFALSC